MRRTMSMVWLCLCNPGSHTVMRQSSPPAARKWPSGLQVRLLTDAASPVNSSVCARRLMRPSLLLKLLSKTRGLMPPICLREGPCEGRWQPSSLEKRCSFVPMAFAITRTHFSSPPWTCRKHTRARWPGCVVSLYHSRNLQQLRGSEAASVALNCIEARPCMEVKSATRLRKVYQK